MKYPINKEFFPKSLFVSPIGNPKIAGWLGSMMRPPRWIWTDPQVGFSSNKIASYDGKEIEILLIEPHDIETADEKSPAIVYYHGGGFMFGAADHHYRQSKLYANELNLRVIFVHYRLMPKHPHPTPAEDCYAALRWTFDNADRLGIDKNRIAVGGDSAGGALAAAVCQMARDRGSKMPLFQLLIYPVTDRRMDTESNRRFTDTPMWNSRLSRKMWQGYVGKNYKDIAYASPAEAESLEGLPPAYLEAAEFDCLHDEGIAYAESLRAAGVPTEINDTRGTMHAFDTVADAPTTKRVLSERIEYMRKMFY